MDATQPVSATASGGPASAGSVTGSVGSGSLAPDGPPPGSSAFGEDELLAAYAVEDRAAPHLRANMISSLDGAATSGGLSGGLNNPADKQVFDMLRRLADVIIVGAGTVRAEGYGAMRLSEQDVCWRRTRGLRDHPVFAIVSASLGLSPADQVFADAPVRPLVVTHTGAPAEQREALVEVADVVDCGRESVEPMAMRSVLAERGLPQMLCEGGPHLLGALTEAGALDELCLTMSPYLEGGSSMRITRDAAEVHQAMRLRSVLRAEDMLMLRYTR